jgi:hypothetical protein
LGIGTNGYVLTSNGTTATWAAASGGVSQIIAGTNVTISPSGGTGAVTINATSGGGGSGLSWQAVQTADFTAVSGNAYPINTTSSVITATLPASPSAGNFVCLTDYAGTFTTNNLTINPNGSKLDGSSSNVFISTNRESIHLVYIDSTQGWIPYSGFNTSTPNASYSASYLIVGGGAPGSVGGGGAGGLRSGTSTLSLGTTYTIVVGAGAAWVNSNPMINGNSSSGLSLTSNGGGGGGAGTTGNGQSGGSGGGTAGGSAGSGTSGQGNNGGTGVTTAGGGGGGAGAVGSSGSGTTGGAGGTGSSSSITGSAVTYAGGGGGAGSNVGGAGGSGGGGTGNTSPSANGGNATANTGGGGGGSYAGTAAGNGGSGVVILSVPTASYSGTVTGSPTVTTSGSNTIIKFTSSGSYTA